MFKPLKTAWNNAIDDFIKTSGTTPKNVQFCEFFSAAWSMATKPEMIKVEFRATGICSLNPRAVPSEAYKPSITKSDAQGQSLE